jgi:hypothetical protein
LLSSTSTRKIYFLIQLSFDSNKKVRLLRGK